MRQFVFVAAFACGVALPQTLDTAILGTITDPTGAVIPGATVTIVQPATGGARTVTTSREGKYEVRYLYPGEYTVEAKLAGFRSERRAGITLQIGQQARVDFSLQIGEVTEAVEVAATALLLPTENATLGQVVAPERIVNLPLNGRDFATLAALTPGVQVTVNLFGLATLVAANGVRTNSMEVSIDGGTASDPRLSYITHHPSIDAIQEFKVQGGNYSAEYGGSAGANINVQIKSGTNRLHGAVFEFLRNNDLDARGYFRPPPLPKDTLRRNQLGAVLNGPIRRDKTFFMVNYEGQRLKTEVPGTNVVPTLAQRTGDFSALPSPVRDPLNGQPFAGNIIPASRVNPVSLNLITAYMPLPNQAGAVNYAGVTSQIADQDGFLARIDHYFGARDQVFGHYMYQNRNYPLVDFNPNFPGDRQARYQSTVLQHVHTFNPSLLNEFRFNYRRGNRFQLSPHHDTAFRAEDIGINGLKVNGPDGRPLSSHEAGFPMINISGFVGLGDRVVNGYPQDFSQTWQFVDNISKIRGNHSLKAGLDARRLATDSSTANVPAGELDFTGDLSGNAMADYLLGFPRTVITPEGIPISSSRQWRYAFYFQDDWKVTRNLTLNLGARYDLIGLPRDMRGAARTLRWDLDPSGPVLWPPPGQSGDLWKNEFWHMVPRIGFAWRVHSQTVVRGGYGIFTTSPILDNVNILQLAPPAAGSVTVINDPRNPIATIQNPVPRELFPTKPLFNVTSLPADRKHINAYYQNWNLQVGHEFTRNDVLEVGYVGTRGTHAYTSVPNFNSPPPGLGDIQARRPYPGFGRIRLEVTDGNPSYHALQARLEHRFSHGLSLTSAYAWSHMIDDSDNSGRAIAQNPLNRGYAERASSNDDIRHRLVTGYTWQLPLTDHLKGPWRLALGEWSLGGLITLQTGQPFNVTQSGDSQNVDPVNGESRPNLVTSGQAALPSSERASSRWFNTAAFTRATLQYGTSPRNPLTGPAVKAFDLSASKSFRMPFQERHELLFRAEFFNAFNTPQFANPGAVLGTATFGRLTATRIDQRQIQFGLKYLF